MIADTSSGIEPLFAIAYMKNVMDGTKLYYINEVFEHVLKVRGIYSEELMQKVIENGSVQNIEEIPKDIRDIFVISYDLAPDAHIRIQAAFQKYTDLAVSKTINLPNTASVEDVKKAYLLAWKLGCKGVTVYRDGSRGEQVLNIIKKPSEPQINSEVRITS
jgi:ribonucleoside-diphosphate reductase alpha chain